MYECISDVSLASQISIPARTRDTMQCWWQLVRTSPDQSGPNPECLSKRIGIDWEPSRSPDYRHYEPSWSFSYQFLFLLEITVSVGPDWSGPDPEYLSKRLESIDSRHGDPVIDIMSRREVAVINFYRIAQIQFFRGDQGGMQVRFHASGTKKWASQQFLSHSSNSAFQRWSRRYGGTLSCQWDQKMNFTKITIA